MSLLTEQIKEKIDIVEFIGGFLKLQKAGKNYKALCPFHQEKTSSFVVSPERRIWHCFGCSEGGDIFKFLIRYESVEFHEALKILAEKAGVELRRAGPNEQKEFGVLYDINAAAQEFFCSELKNEPRARDYLAKRGLKPETIEEFFLGWAPGGEDLTIFLLNVGYDIGDINRAGLTLKTESGIYRDRFNKRIIFPIFSHFGKTIGFTGRILPAFETDKTPKYLNSPETPIFNKSRILYGLHKSRQEIGRSRQAILAEGQMDFLMLWQSGFKNATASSGTAFGVDHLRCLERLADVLVVSFDKDEAGLKALERTLDLTVNFDFLIKALDLGSFKDPAEAVLADPLYLKTALEKVRPAMSYVFESRLMNYGKLDLAGKKNILRFLLNKVKNIKSPIDQSHWLKELAVLAGVEERILFLEMDRLKTEKIDNSAVSGSRQLKEEKTRYELIAEKLLCLALAKDDFSPQVLASRNYFPRELQAAVADFTLVPELGLRASYEFTGFDDLKLKKELEELLKNLKLEYFRQRSLGLKKEINEAELLKNEELVKDLIGKFQTVCREINNLTV